MIVLTGEMRLAVDNALDDGCPVISSSVDGDGQPSLSFYGSTQVHGDDQLAIWVRNPAGAILRRIAANPHVAFLYRNPDQRQMWQFHGRARVVEDQDRATRSTSARTSSSATATRSAWASPSSSTSTA